MAILFLFINVLDLLLEDIDNQYSPCELSLRSLDRRKSTFKAIIGMLLLELSLLPSEFKCSLNM